MRVRKAIIPVAGLGTRMLPATKAIPKEMLPIVDKPLIQYIVNEAIQAGIKEIVLVTHSSKNAIENHFDRSFELEATLEKRVKRQLLSEVQSICPKDVTIMQVRQGEAKGLGQAIMCAEKLIENQPFAILLPDVLIDQYHSNLAKDNLAEMIKNYEETGVSQILVEKVPHNNVSSYGIVEFFDNKSSFVENDKTLPIKNLVEKPQPEDAPSDYSIVGRYVLSPNIWPLFKETPLGAGDEIQLTDTIKILLNQNQVNAYNIIGKSLDCGNKLGYMKAAIEYGIMHREIGDDFSKFLKDFVKEF